jgi:chitinase
MPASQLLLGLPLYGYVTRSKAKKLSGSLVPMPGDPNFPPGAHPRGPPSSIRVPEVGTAPTGDLSHLWGQQISFSQLLSSGALYKKSDGTYDGANGFTVGWDDCSDTPVRKRPDDRQFKYR